MASESFLEESTIQKNQGERNKQAKVSDTGNICLLLLLYVLQGIPLGLSASIPMILQNRHVSYKDQATFSLALWPFSVKLLWAPIVDSLYFASFGRRKSWLVPAQYLIGVFMLVLSFTLNSVLGPQDGDNSFKPNVIFITVIFFALNFLAATQDIAVDGWALTMLSRDNVAYASTCNSVGQTAGFFLGYVVFLVLDGAVIQLDQYMYFWGVFFIITTTLVWALKKEDDESTNADDGLGLKETYMTLFTILKKTDIQKCVLILLTCKIGFAAADSLTGLKLIESGVPKDKLALLSVPLTPVQILLPFVVSRYTTGSKPMEVFIKAIPYRLGLGLVFAVIVHYTHSLNVKDGHFSSYYYLLIVFVYILHQITTNCMFVAIMAFFARISDPAVGGTYMTLLNTFTNLGGNWPTWVALRFVSDVTWHSCVGALVGNTCANDAEKEACTAAGGSCRVELDGYYVLSLVCVVIGILWMRFGIPLIRKLQDRPMSSWLVKDGKPSKTA